MSDRLEHLARLGEDWDSYGGHPPTPDALHAAKSWTAFLLSEVHGLPEPQVVPTSAGGVQLEWHLPGAHMEIELRPEGIVGESVVEIDGKEHELDDRELVPAAASVLARAS